MSSPLTLLEWSEVKWGIQPCTGRRTCYEMADLLFDGQPLCVDCADVYLQRIIAIGMNQTLRTLLPDLWDTALP